MVRKKIRAAWGLADAKARFSEVLARATREPQVIQRRGRAVGVIVAIDRFHEAERRAMAASATQRMHTFLDTCAAIRQQGGIDLPVAKRESRKSPFSRP